MTTLDNAPPRIHLRPELAAFAEYHPVTSPEALAAELGLPPERILKLDANENPYGPPPGVAAALAGIDPRLYPDADARALREALAAYTGQPAARIICTNGLDEFLELLCRLFIVPGDAVVTVEPTFGMYAIAARQHGGVGHAVARDPHDWRLDPDAVLAAARPGTRLIFICAPNNPTGTLLPAADLRAVLDAAPCVVVVDEAYAEFADADFLALTDEYPHLIILRTLSKMAGLAGLRVGYGIVAPPIAQALWKIKAPYNVNLAGQVAGVAALADRVWIADKIARLRAGRTLLADALAGLPGATVYPSAGNFLLIRLAGGAAAADALYMGLRRRGTLVRRYTHEPLLGCLRISVGTEAQNARLIEEVQELWPSR